MCNIIYYILVFCEFSLLCIDQYGSETNFTKTSGDNGSHGSLVINLTVFRKVLYRKEVKTSV